MEVILVHKQNTSSALIACASSHYSYNQLTAALPRNPKVHSKNTIFIDRQGIIMHVVKCQLG